MKGTDTACCVYDVYLFYFIYFIYLFASDTHNLDHMYPYQLLVVLGGKCESIVDNHC